MFLKNRNLLTKKQGLFDWRSKYTSVPGQLTPLDFDGIHTWLRADADVILDGSNRVSSWSDPISGNVFSQVTSTRRPYYNESDINWNGHPSLYFSGSTGDGVTNDFLTSTLANTAWNFLHHGPATVFFVQRNTTALSNRISLTTGGAGGGGVAGFIMYSTGTPALGIIVQNIGSTIYVHQSNTALETKVIWMTAHDSERDPDILVRKNGTTTFNNNYTNPSDDGDCANALQIGGVLGNSDQFTSPEIIIYNRVLTLSEIQAIENYLNNKYDNLL